MEIGDIIQTMEYGHIVDAKITKCLESDEWSGQQYECEFVSHYKTGSTHLWLDLGQRVKAYPGYTFVTSEHYINAAQLNIEKYNIKPEY